MSVTLCQVVSRVFWCCVGVLLIVEVVDQFRMIGDFVRNLCKLGFQLENKANHRLVLDFTKLLKFCESGKISQLGSEFLTTIKLS